jgi:hypothetical protein
MPNWTMFLIRPISSCYYKPLLKNPELSFQVNYLSIWPSENQYWRLEIQIVMFAKILRDTNSGLMLSYEDLAGISSVINEVIQGEFGKDFQYKGIEQYSRRSITSRLASILDSFQ